MDEHDIGSLHLNIELDTDSLSQGIDRMISLLRKLTNYIDQAAKSQESFNKTLGGFDLMGNAMDTATKGYISNSNAIVDNTAGAIKAIGGLTGTFFTLKGAIVGFSAGSAVGAAIGAVTGIVADAFVAITNTIKKEEEEQQKIFDSSLSISEQTRAQMTMAQRSMDILNDPASSTQELIAARNTLAKTADGVVAGYDKEGNAILFGNEIIQQRIDELTELNRVYQDNLAQSLPEKFSSYKNKKDQIKAKENAIGTTNDSLKVWLDVQETDPGAYEERVVSLRGDLTSLNKELNDLQREKTVAFKDYKEAYLAAVRSGIEGYSEMDEAAQHYIDSLAMGLIDSVEYASEMPDILNQITASFKNITGFSLEEYTSQLHSYSDAAREVAESANLAAAAAEQQLYSFQSLSSAFQTLQEGGSLSSQTLYDLASAFPAISDYLEQTGDLTLNNGQVLQNIYNEELRAFQQSQEIRLNNLISQRDDVQKTRDLLQSKAEAYIQCGNAIMAANYLSQIKDQDKSLEQINADIEKLRAASATINAIPFGGGNSGGSKSSGSSKNEALQKEIKLLEQKKKMDQVTSEEELAWLERMLGQYRMSAEERQDLEYRIYQVKKKLQDEEEKRLQQQIKQLDELGSAVTSALKARYEEQKEIEQKRIDDSIQSWKNWEEQTVAAIQGQIDALDDLEKEQESADKRAEYERSKQALELQKAYEKDLYQREMIQKEINRLDKEEQKRLEQEARDELRKQLEQQIEDAKEQSKQKQEALEKESEALDETYEKLMQDSALKAEAERMLMQASQEDILQLLQSYAPDYEVVGQSMGEKLVEGFTQKVGSLEDYFNRVQARIDAFHSAVADNANQAADHFYASRAEEEARIAAQAAPTNIQMTVNFNQPVESPIETRRELEKAMQSMVVKIQQGG